MGPVTEVKVIKLDSVTRIGDLLDFWQLFEASGNN